MSSTLTSTTAPGKEFFSRTELAEHYKSDWHKYNLKRREAGLALLEETDFQARWEAALALRKEKERKAHNGTDHIKASKKKNKKSQKQERTSTPEPIAPKAPREAPIEATKEASTEKVDKVNTPQNENGYTFQVFVADDDAKTAPESQETPEINPKQSLFDSHISDSLKENLEYMQNEHGFFVPDQECLVELEGLLGYCQEKIKLGHYCLYCEKMFPTWQGCQKHMVSKQHTKLRYEQGYWEELDVFYDFKRENSNFWGVDDAAQHHTGDAMDEDDEDGWEDMSEGEERDQDEDDMFNGYKKEIARFGLDVTPLGELVFPDGRIVGHRALGRYYKQRVRPVSSSTAIVAARQAAGERMYEGRVVNINQPMSSDKINGAGKGILVPLKDGAAGFSVLSLYRYRAAIRKQHRGEDKGRKIKQRTTLNINRMDKKANRLMNGVSVAHAAR